MNKISFASGIVPECRPVETICAAAAGAFDATGLWIGPENWTAAVTRECHAALADTGLELLDVEVIWIKPDSDMSVHKAVIDPIHVDRSGTKASEIASVPRELLPYAQFCDAPAKRPDLDNFEDIIIDAIDLREQCGKGGLDLFAIYNALPSNIPLSIELRSKSLRDAYPDPSERAKAVAIATRVWLAEHTA